jgi:hypothetical protein
MKASDVYEMAMALIDAPSFSPGSEEYEEKAPKLIDELQRDLVSYEGKVITGHITSLNDELQISDDTAQRIMPYGLAASFALMDRYADMYSDYSYMYRALIRTIRPEAAHE